VKGAELVAALKKYFAEQNQTESVSDSSLAKQLGQTQANISQWKARQNEFSARQIVNLLQRHRKVVEAELASKCINPIVEFFPISRVNSRHGAKQEIFSTKDGPAEHPYRAGIKKVLCETQGLYFFYDSRGRALYAGRTNEQSLWNEINGAFNRERGKELQSIKIVSHPERKQRYERYDEKTRQITSVAVALHEVAEYFSAYEVHPLMIKNLESLVIRSFANDLLNKKMEHFGTKSKK
jgi:hypothetical protein